MTPLNFEAEGTINWVYKTKNTRRHYSNAESHILIGDISYKGLGVYAKYSPMHLMRGNAGLQFSGFSTGVTLLL